LGVAALASVEPTPVSANNPAAAQPQRFHAHRFMIVSQLISRQLTLFLDHNRREDALAEELFAVRLCVAESVPTARARGPVFYLSAR
jgi:hypothetical protein